MVTKAAVDNGNTRWAQGGVAVVLPGEHDAGDTVARHIADTLTAGAGLCDADAVAAVITDGPAAVAGLRALGAVFDPDDTGDHLARAREGGHSAFRVIHAGGDATGAEVERALLAATHDAALPVLTDHVAVDALHTASGAVGGLLVLDSAGIPGIVRAPPSLLATGGLGQLYQATSNPEVATADGLALALRAGAAVADLEFVQFHPTVLFTGSGARGRCPLVTEAVRGEGAVLVDRAGQRVMLGVAPAGRPGPARRGQRRDHPQDGAKPAPTTSTSTRPTSAPRVRAAASRPCTPPASPRGIDPAHDPIPVTPAAHFACGGVSATVDGRTDVTGLYAAGEVARTGLHGANRLASNSLLEGLVVGRRAARAVAHDLATGALGDPRTAEPQALPGRADRRTRRAAAHHEPLRRRSAATPTACRRVGHHRQRRPSPVHCGHVRRSRTPRSPSSRATCSTWPWPAPNRAAATCAPITRTATTRTGRPVRASGWTSPGSRS